MRIALTALALGFFLSAAPAVAQSQSPGNDTDGASRPIRTVRPVLEAIRLEGAPPTIDGLLDEPLWLTGAVANDFVQLEPEEGNPATERTEVRVLYGEDALYVAFRAYDSAPDDIAGQLTRRDVDSYSDRVHVIIDSYFDRRTAFHFGVNPVGVKLDIYRYDDTREDSNWDAVWDVATNIDEEGWTAEFRIPYSQLRFANDADQTWGIQFAREIARKRETTLWAPMSQSENRLVSMAGELRGLTDLGSPRRMELLPYTMARVARAPGDEANPFYSSTDWFGTVGADVKYGVTNNLTLDLTINPDFGQVEADPAQVNLTAFETFFPEKRPFFVEGASIFNFGIGIGGGSLGNESLFYSRRVGRAPQGWADPQGGYTDTPNHTTIMGAWKLSGKTANGWSIGVLHALTSEETADIETGAGSLEKSPVEPLTNYGVARVQKDFREGSSAIGFIGTVTNREPEIAEDLVLRSGAYAGGIDFRHRFGNDNFQLSGYLLGSHVRGSEDAITLTQRSPARYFQRPDAEHVEYDPTRTSLNGWGAQVQLGKIGGGFWNYGAIFMARSPGFEVNDIGYMNESDLILPVVHGGYNHYLPGDHLREWRINVSSWRAWSFGSEFMAQGGDLSGAVTFHNYWNINAGMNVEGEGYSNTTLRGGPMFRRPASLSGRIGVNSDSRRTVSVSFNNSWSRAPESDSWSWSTSGHVRWRPSGRINLSLGPSYSRSVNDAQWVQRVVTDETDYLFGRIDQTTVGVTGRFDVTFTPNLSLQLYAQPYVSAGDYAEFKRVADPVAEEYRNRFQLLDYTPVNGHFEADVNGDGFPETIRNPDFNFKQFRSNAVLRWEYRPGSILYLVWSQGRNHYLQDGTFGLGDDLGTLFRQDAENVFMIKLSYWLNP